MINFRKYICIILGTNGVLCRSYRIWCKKSRIKNNVANMAAKTDFFTYLHDSWYQKIFQVVDVESVVTNQEFKTAEPIWLSKVNIFYGYAWV